MRIKKEQEHSVLASLFYLDHLCLSRFLKFLIPSMHGCFGCIILQSIYNTRNFSKSKFTLTQSNDFFNREYSSIPTRSLISVPQISTWVISFFDRSVHTTLNFSIMNFTLIFFNNPNNLQNHRI